MISEAGYKDAFRHSTGHGVGLEIHESPLFAPSYDKPVPAGAVLSVEPGIYLPDKFGVRIEDVVYVTDNGCIDITKCEKKLIEL
ncbi:Aminopeptidase YpdF [bioreactor metagenome]|uniref:Aminopeptidase YpdF n=1 Tax=bioreactor metagenome TaxID=1076179 RepID=A0A645EWQ6_9ZZZZ